MESPPKLFFGSFSAHLIYCFIKKKKKKPISFASITVMYRLLNEYNYYRPCIDIGGVNNYLLPKRFHYKTQKYLLIENDHRIPLLWSFMIFRKFKKQIRCADSRENYLLFSFNFQHCSYRRNTHEKI